MSGGEAALRAQRVAEAQACRGPLRGLAYRMLGSAADAEDLVQDVTERYLQVTEVVAAPRAYLTRMLTRACVDHLRSARVRRERSVGMWLAEPVVDVSAWPAGCAVSAREGGAGAAWSDPEAALGWASDLSFALLLLFERLSPLERAAFLLREAFGYEYTELSALLERTEASCRQLVARARRKLLGSAADGTEAALGVSPVTQRGSPGERAELASAFFRAVQEGQLAEIEQLLAQGAVLVSDGGGVRTAALRPIEGAARIARFFVGVRRRWPRRWLHQVELNGLPAWVTLDADGDVSAFALEVDGRQGRVQRIFVHRDPSKLAQLRQQLGC